MANQRDVKDEINYLPQDPFADKIDPAGQNRKTYQYTTLKEGAAAFFKKNILKDAKVFQAVVIDVEYDSPLLRQRTARGQADSSEVKYVAVRARIPKLHAHVLSPKTIPMDKSKPGAKGIIQQHPLFIARIGPKTPIPAEGSVIKVSFGKGPVSGQYDGVYLELYEGPAAFDDKGAAVDPSTRLEFAQNPGTRLGAREEGDGVTTMTPVQRQQAELHAKRGGEPGNSAEPGGPPGNGETPFPKTPFATAAFVTSEYGLTRGTDTHKGIDFRAPIGTKLYAVCAGTVRIRNPSPEEVTTGLAEPPGSDANKNARAGKFVEITRADGVKARYLHMSLIEPDIIAKHLATPRGSVVAGEAIGLTGDLGAPGQPHLHFEVKIGTTPVNPRRYLTNAAFIRRPNQQTREATTS